MSDLGLNSRRLARLIRLLYECGGTGPANHDKARTEAAAKRDAVRPVSRRRRKGRVTP